MLPGEGSDPYVDKAFALLHLFVADALVYVFDKLGQVSALDAQSGEQRWGWQMEGDMLEKWQEHNQANQASLHGNQAIFSSIADGTLYVVAGDTVYALS